jgi:uncharacterized protein (DUF302 family)
MAAAERSPAVDETTGGIRFRNHHRRTSRANEPTMNGSHIPYGLKRTLDIGVEEADRRVREALQEEGFGVLTEIDVQEILKKKLDVDFRPYRILGACNPPLAHRALTSETDIGLLLPCNVIVYAGEDEGTSVVAILDPVNMLGLAGRDDMSPMADEVRSRMERVLAAL